MSWTKYGVAIIAVFLTASTNKPVDAMLDSYRSWQALTDEPEKVPYELSIQCMRVTEEQL